MLGGLIKDLAACDDETADRICLALNETSAAYLDDSVEYLCDFLRVAGTEELETIMVGWCVQLKETWQNHVDPLLAADCDEAKLEAWCTTQAGTRQRMQKFQESSQAAKKMLLPGAEASRNFDVADHYERISAWAVMANEAISMVDTTAASLAMAMDLKAGIVKLLSAFPCDGCPGDVALTSFQTSPVFAHGSKLHKFIGHLLTTHSSGALQPLVTGVLKHFTTAPVRALGISGAEVAFVEKLAAKDNMGINNDKFAAAAKWATESADSKLHAQVSLTKHFCDMATAIARCEAHRRVVLVPTLEMKVRRISKEAVSLLKEVRTSLAAMKTYLTPQRLALLCSSSEDGHHADTLDGLFNVVEMQSSLEGDANGLQTAYTESWKSDMDKVAASIDSCCPHWSHVKLSLLSCPDVMASLCKNIHEHYADIGPLAGEAVVL